MHCDTRLRPILELCLASLVYHADYLVATLPPTHALRSSYLFRHSELVHKMKQDLVHDETSWMAASGILPHIELYVQQERTRDAVKRLPSVLLDGMTAMLDGRGARSGNMTKEVLETAIKDALASAGVTSAINTEPQQRPTTTTKEVNLWGGKLHVLPMDFEFPSVDTNGAWKLWHFGNETLGHPPYRRISTHDLSTIEAVERHTRAPMPTTMTEEEAAKFFDIGFQGLNLGQANHQRRQSQLKMTTTLRLVRESAKASNPDYRPQPFRRRKRSRPQSRRSVDACQETT